MIGPKRVETLKAGLRHLEDVVVARQLLLDLYRRQSANWKLDHQLLQQAQADLKHCQQLWLEERFVELVVALRKAGIKVQPRNRKAKQKHKEAA